MGTRGESSRRYLRICGKPPILASRGPKSAKMPGKLANLYPPSRIFTIASELETVPPVSLVPILMSLVPIRANPHVDLERNGEFGGPRHVLPQLQHDRVHGAIRDLQNELVVHLHDEARRDG